jgi:hypothetical protein
MAAPFVLVAPIAAHPQTPPEKVLTMPNTAQPNDPADRALQLAIARAVARAWRDPEFRARLEADPRGVLIEGGADVPEGVDVVIAPEGTQVLALPDAPPDDPDAAAEAAARQAYEAIFGRPAE